MIIKPLYDYLVVDTEDKKETTKSGFILPSASESKYAAAIVKAVGAGGKLYGNEVSVTVKVGDKVLFTADSAQKIKIDGEEFTIIRQSDVIAVIE